MRMWALFIMTCLLVAILGLGIIDNAKVSAKDEDVSVKALSVKVDQLLANQQTILAKLDEIQKELNVVKIRATRA